MTKRLLLALSSSLLLILIAPRWSFGFLAPVALAPLLLAIREEISFRRRLLLGLAAGIPYWFFVCLWIEHVLSFHGGLDKWLAWVSFLLFCILKSLHLALFSGLAGTLPRSSRWFVPVTAALWVGIERTHGTFGFAWLTLGDAGIDIPWLLGVPSLIGVYGLSFLFALSAAAAALTIETRHAQHLAWLAAFLLPFLALPAAPSAPTQSALVVQPMMPQASEWTRELLDQKLKGLVALSMTGDAPLLIWPEMPGPLYFDGDPAFHEIAVTLAQSRSRYFLFGTVTRGASSKAPLNTAIMLSPTGAEMGRYSKVNLVPFGEYVPSAFSWVNRITQEAGDFEPGASLTTFPAAGEATAGVFICYESAFPEFVRQFARAGASYFANISNDGYFGESKAREQHLSLVRMRAVENRRWIIRATNSGITAVIDPLGRVAQTLPEYQHTSAIVRYGVNREITPYSRFGDWFAWTCLAAGGMAAGAAVLASVKRGH